VKPLLIAALLALAGCVRVPRAYYDPIRHEGCAGTLYLNGVRWTAEDAKKYDWPDGSWWCEGLRRP